MRKTFSFLSVCAMLALCSLTALAHRAPLAYIDQPQDQCSAENKAAWYAAFRKDYKDDQAKAYDAAKKYLACPGDPNDQDEASRIAYLQKFVSLYEKANEKASRKAQLKDAIYTKKDYAKAFELGKQVLADEPDNFLVYLDLGYAAFAAFNSGNKHFVNDGVASAKKAIEMIESGKTPPDWKPVVSKEDTLAKLNYWIAALKQDATPAEAIPYWIKAASYDTFKKSVEVYYNLGLAYERGPYQKQFDDYNRLYKDKPETPESKLALENINQILDRVIDAYARAVALAGSNPDYKDLKADAMTRLTDWYKFRHNQSDAGLNEMIAGILSKPLPPEPTPITSLPTPPSTPASGPGSSTSGTGADANTPAKTTTAPTARTSKPKTHRAHVAP